MGEATYRIELTETEVYALSAHLHRQRLRGIYRDALATAQDKLSWANHFIRNPGEFGDELAAIRVEARR